METYTGYLYAKLNAIGTRSEGPVYLLQQYNYIELTVIKAVPPWKEDPNLHPLLGRKVKLQGGFERDGIRYDSAVPVDEIEVVDAPIDSPCDVSLELRLQLDSPVWINKKPGPTYPPDGAAMPPQPPRLHLTLGVTHDRRCVWQGVCPSTQIYDFIVERDGETVWRWSERRFFAQVITPVAIPGGSRHEFDEVWDVPLETDPGEYTARAIFIASGQEIIKDFEIKVAE